MPKQEGEPAFAPDESLFRRLIAEWDVGDGTVDDAAVEVPQFSVDRGRFCTADKALANCDDDEVAVAEFLFRDLPPSFVPDGPVGEKNSPKTYETVVVYDPQLENDAHTHVEFRRERELKSSKPGPIMKTRIRREVAGLMRVVRHRT